MTRLLGLLLALALVATGCAGTADSRPVVTYLTWETPDTNKTLDAAMAGQPVRLNRLPSPGYNYDQKVAALFLSGKAPDFFWCGNDTEQSLGQKGLLYDWTDYLARRTNGMDPAKFVPGALDYWRGPDHRLYGLPTLVNAYGFYYNEKLLAAAGVPAPRPGWTYDQLFAAAAALTKANGPGLVVDAKDGGWGSPFYGPFGVAQASMSAGGKPFENRAVGATAVQVDTGFTSMTTKLTAAITAGQMTLPGAGSGDTTAAFAGGRTAMLFGGQWLAPVIAQGKPAFGWGFAPMPENGRSVQPLDAVGICAPKTLRNPDQVWAVMTYLVTTGLRKLLSSAPVAPSAYAPTSVGYFAAIAKIGDGSVSRAVAYEVDCPDKTAIRFVEPWAIYANNVLKGSWDQMLSGQRPIGPTLAATVRDINAIIPK
ncbi:ABC transporter substrate-binding protein [Fodinicola acaciae]|uniref:ABC transporter substrate-binding protein n=1 Tax=Fodinicola acaciae TaxID=2681555 RepID=UPI0013D74701|nr:extracellular solute-binding protein [Fodinicola acaciae]